MAIAIPERPGVEAPVRPEPDVQLQEAPPVGLLKRPTITEGVWGWITTVDHKRVGVMYGVTAMIFFIVGGLEASLIRLQLARPNGNVLSEGLYNEVFTMHGTTMVFLVIMPFGAAFANYLVPLMIGARDVAFPRLNALSYWVFLFGGLFIFSSFLFGGAPNGGWFGYVPNSTATYNPGVGMDFWTIGLLILGTASTVGAVNLVTTFLNLRAPGMSLLRVPVFVWSSMVAQFLTLFAMPIITVALFLLLLDRQFGANFFNPAEGGDPVLWQHLFWLFGHPEVYILILPAFGIISEVLPVFSRKPLFGYPVIVFSSIAIGFIGWGVWVHHMFAVGLGPVAISAFSLSTMFIAVPTGVKIFNWISTLWGGSLRFTTPMLFAIGLVSQFTIGGLSGVTHAVSPHDRQQTDTYYVVAHFHYVIFGGALLGIFAGMYYWWPKVFGRMLNEGLGKVHFWLTLVGMTLAFGPMHLLGLQGMPRRISTYPEGMGWDVWNLVATIGTFLIGVATLVFLYNVWYSRKNGAIASADPWDGRTIEWGTPSPTPVYNFAEIPTIHSVDDFWHRKYGEDEEGRLVRLLPSAAAAEQLSGQSEAGANSGLFADGLEFRTAEGASPDAPSTGGARTDVAERAEGSYELAEDAGSRSITASLGTNGHDGTNGHGGNGAGTGATGGGGNAYDPVGGEGGGQGHAHEGHHIHLPSPSYWPILAAACFPMIGYGMIFETYVVAILAGLALLAVLYAWSLEPSAEPIVAEAGTIDIGPGDPVAHDVVMVGGDADGRDGADAPDDGGGAAGSRSAGGSA